MKRTVPVTDSLQDYLEAILSLSGESRQAVRVTDIAARLNIAKASVTQALGLLKEQGLIRQDRYGPVELTASGRIYALQVQYRHEVLRYFLIEVLGVPPSIAEEDACLLEHDLSNETFECLLLFLEKQELSPQFNRKMFKDKEGAGDEPDV